MILASFTAPIHIGCDLWHFFWALPLILLTSLIIRASAAGSFEAAAVVRSALKMFFVTVGVMILTGIIFFGVVEYIC